MAKCKRCGKEFNDSDLNKSGLCSVCEAIERDIAREELEVQADGEWAGTYREVHEGEIELHVENLARSAVLHREAAIKNKRKDREDAKAEYENQLDKLLIGAGVVNTNEKQTFKPDIQKLYDKFRKEIDSGVYRVCKASALDKEVLDKLKVVEASRGLIVYDTAK